MSSPSINVKVGFWNHWKTRRLVGLLGRGAELLPLRLWSHCGEYHAKDGRMTDYSPQEIESIAGWWGKPGEMVEAMLNLRFLEKVRSGFQIHGWKEHEGHLEVFQERARAAANVRWERVRAQTAALKSSQPSNASSIATAVSKQSSCGAMQCSAVQVEEARAVESHPPSSTAESPPVEPGPPPASGAVAEFEEAFAASHDGRRPMVNKSCAVTLSKIRKTLGGEKFRDVVVRFCLDQDPWVTERDHAPGLLQGQLPRILKLVNGNGSQAVPKGYSSSILTGSQEGGWKPANADEAERFERMRRGEVLDD